MKIKKKLFVFLAVISLIILSLAVIVNNTAFATEGENQANKEQVAEKEITQNDDWKTTINLPKYDENGKLITYEVDEKDIPEGYTKTVEGNTITNTINQYNYKVEYYYDGVLDESKTDTIMVDYGTTINNYTDKNITGYKLEREEGTGLKVGVNEDTNIIKIYYIKDSFNYTVHYFYDGIEDESAKETISATYQDIIDTYTDKNKTGYIFEKDENKGFTVTENEANNYINVYYVTETTELSGTKTWKDDNNALGLRPESYTVKLYANDTYLKEETFTEENWSFTGLQKYDYTTGEEINYTISEDEIILDNGDKYTPTINGTDIVNTLTGTTQIEVVKTWSDNDNINQTRPNSITVLIRKILGI